MSNERHQDDYLKDIREGLNVFGQKVNRMMGDLFSSEANLSELKVLSDIYETDTQYVVELELPGLTKEFVSIQVIERTLSIKGVKTKSIQDRTYRYEGRQYGEFLKSFEIPEYVELKNIKASFDSGVLRVRFPLILDELEDATDINID